MTRADLSGQWEFDAPASSLQLETPEAVELSIAHAHPRFRLTRTLVVAGQADTFSIELTIGGANPPFRRGAATLHPSLRWDGDELVFETRIVGEGLEAFNVVRYRLEEGGSVLIAEERFTAGESGYQNTWVFRAPKIG